MDKTTRHFEFKDDKSAKFWEITQTSNTVTVRYGKTGTNGQTLEKAFADAAAAGKHAAKLIAEKLGKGYIEQGNAPVIGADAQAAPDVPVEKGLKPGAESVAKKVPVKAAKAQPVKSAKPKNPAQDPEATPESLMGLLEKDDATNRLLAKHPRASSKLLEKLSHSSDQATRRAVAGNPNTPPQIYVRLGQQFPKEFLANPMLDLLLMENPALMVEVPETMLIRLLKQADCPQSLLAWAAGHDHENVQLAVATNARAPEQALKKLRTSSYPAVSESVLARSSAEYEQEDPEQAFDQAVRKRLWSLTHTELQEAWSAGDIGLAQWSALPLPFRLFMTSGGKLSFKDLPHKLPAPVLEALSKDSDRLIRAIVGRNPSAPVPVLEVLANDSQWRVRWDVAGNPFAPAYLLEALAKDSDLNVRSAVAGNPSAPAPVLEVLARESEDVNVRRKAAGNPSAQVPVLEALAKDLDLNVSSAVARNPSATVPVLKVLAKHSHEEVRADVASNPLTPELVLETLAKDSSEGVRLAVAKNPSTEVLVLEVLAKDSSRSVRLCVARNPSAPDPVLTALAKDSDDEVRAEVAINPGTPVLLLEALVKDSKKRVRLAVARNPSAPSALQDVLTKDSDDEVRAEVAINPGTPVLCLRHWSRIQKNGFDWQSQIALPHPCMC